MSVYIHAPKTSCGRSSCRAASHGKGKLKDACAKKPIQDASSSGRETHLYAAQFNGFQNFQNCSIYTLIVIEHMFPWLHSPLETSAAEQVQKGTEASKARNSQLTYKSQSVKEEKDNKSGFGIRKAVRTHTLETNDGGVSLVTRCASLDQKGGQRRHHKGRYIRISCLSPWSLARLWLIFSFPLFFTCVSSVIIVIFHSFVSTLIFRFHKQSPFVAFGGELELAKFCAPDFY